MAIKPTLKLTPIILKEINRYLTTPKKVRKFGFDDTPVKTGKDIERPQEALDREMFKDAEERFNKADGGRIGFADGPKSSKVKTKEFPVKRQFYNRRTGKLETLYFKGQESTKVATPLPKNKIPKFKKLYKEQNSFKTMAKKLGVSYDVLKDLEEDLINKGDLQKRKLSRVPSFRDPVTGQIETKATIARAKKVTQMADFIEKEIEKFNKNKILPNEKYEVDYNKLKKKFNITKAETLTGFLNSVDAEKDLDYIRPATSEKGTNRRTGLTDAQVNKYKKEYKSKPLSQIAREMTGKSAKNIETLKIKSALERLRNALVDKKLINVENIATRASVPFDPTFKIGAAEQAQRLQKQVNLAKLDPRGIIDDPKYFSKRGPFTGKFNPQTFDRELLKFLNMDTVAGSLDPKLFEKGQAKFLKPSFEHIQGITPGDIIGDSQALRNVTIATRRYNFQEMGTTSNLYKDVKDYLRVAMAALKNNDKVLANDAVRIVNEVYDKVSKRFPNLDRKDLPNYSIKGNNVKETNLKGLIKPQKLEDSFKQYFKSAADTIKPSELRIAERVQPNFAKVINLFKDGKINEGYDLIKSRIPSVKGGAKFAVPILAGGAALNFLTSPAEAADDNSQSTGFTTGEKAAGAAAAGSLAIKPVRKAALKTAAAALGPLPVAATYPAFGFDIKNPIDRLILGAELAGAPSLVKASLSATDKIKNPFLRKAAQSITVGSPKLALRLARAASPLGIASLAGEGLYQAGKFAKKRMDELQAMSPEQRQALRARQAAFAFEGAREGGIIGKKSGPPPVSGPMPHGLPYDTKGVKKL